MSKHNVQYNVEADALRMGFVKRRQGPDFHKIRWELRCSKCPMEFAANWDGGMKPEAMARHMRMRQWDVDYGMRPLCPNCVHKKDKGPVAKPEHQNFKPYVPPETLIFNRLLVAAEERSFKENFPKLLTEAIDAEAEAAKRVTAARNHLVDTRATAREEDRKRRFEERREKHRAAALLYWERRRAAKAAGAEALRLAQLKERPSTPKPTIAQWIPTPAPQRITEIIPATSPQESATMTNKPTPTPKITHAVFQCLDAIFDPAKRLYRSGYTDQRVAKECGTSEDVVAYLRTETFGQLAEDPRFSALRDDLELLRMESAEVFAKLQKSLGDAQSRLEQLAHR